MVKKYFGTDGIRGRGGEPPITAEFMLRLGWAAGKVFAREGRGHILIGKDTRVSGYMFESALEAGLAAAGIDVMLLGPMPTPAIAQSPVDTGPIPTTDSSANSSAAAQEPASAAAETEPLFAASEDLNAERDQDTFEDTVVKNDGRGDGFLHF